MKIQNGTVYMSSISEDTNVMGAVIARMWWKPWRWQVTPLYYREKIIHTNVLGFTISSQEGKPIRNLTKVSAVGLMKLMGIKHKDFEDEERARDWWG